MLIIAITVAVLTGFAVWIRFHSRIARTSIANKGKHSLSLGGHVASEPFLDRAKSDFRAVTIDASASDSPCARALELCDTPILMCDAPMLPLPDCDVAECRCASIRHDDRRQLDRRASHRLHEAVCQARGINNRRSPKDRRRTD